MYVSLCFVFVRVAEDDWQRAAGRPCVDGWICVTVLLSSTGSDIALLFAFKMCFAARVARQSKPSQAQESAL